MIAFLPDLCSICEKRTPTLQCRLCLDERCYACFAGHECHAARPPDAVPDAVFDASETLPLTDDRVWLLWTWAGPAERRRLQGVYANAALAWMAAHAAADPQAPDRGFDVQEKPLVSVFAADPRPR